MQLLIALVLAQAVSLGNPRGPIFSQSSLTGQRPLFEAFPASGAGTTVACSTTAPTGAKGETLTFTRASTGICTKTAAGGFATTGIANGDLVSLTTDKARVEYDSAGKLKLLVEPARTNTTLRSQEINVAPWGDSYDAAPNTPVLNGTTSTAPDGTATAEDYTFGGAGWAAAASYSYRYQTDACPAGTTATLSVYAKSVSGGTTLDLTVINGGGSYASATCTINTSSWTRCSFTSTTSAATPYAYVGVGQVSGATTRSTTRALVWQAQCEAGANASSSIPTTSAGVARAAESPYFTVSIPGPTYSIAASFETPVSVASSSSRVATLFQDVTHYTDDYFPTRFTAFVYDGASDSKLHSASLTTSGRVASYLDSTNLGACVNGACETVAASASWTAWTRVRIGVDGVGGTAGHINGLVGEVCVDPSATRCR